MNKLSATYQSAICKSVKTLNPLAIPANGFNCINCIICII